MAKQAVVADRAKLSAFAAAQHGFPGTVNAGAFKAALPNVCAKLMASAGINKANVRVTFQGTKAFANYTPHVRSGPRDMHVAVKATLNLPALNEERTMLRAEANRWLGYALHEMLHVILTPRYEWDAMVHRFSPFRRILVNAVEDPRIEHAGMKRGICAGFANVGTLLLQHLLATTPTTFDPNSPGGFPFAVAVVLRDYGGEGQERIEQALNPKMRAVMDEAVRLYKALNPLTSTFQDAVRIAERIADMLKQMGEQEKPEQPDQPNAPEGEPNKDGEPSDEPKDGDEGEGDDDQPEGDDADGDQPEGDDAEGDDDQPEGEGDDDQPEGDDADGDADDDTPEGEGEGEGDADDEGDAEGDEGGDGEGGGNARSKKPTDEQATMEDFADLDDLKIDDMVQVEPTLEVEQAKSEDDGAVEITNGTLKDHLAQDDQSGYFASAVLRMARVAGVRTQLRRLLERTDQSGEVRGLPRGTLVTSALARSAVGDTNLFSRRWEIEGEDAAVSIIVDMSSSMMSGQYPGDVVTSLPQERTCLGVAIKTALTIAECLEQTRGCKVEVLGFPGPMTNLDMERDTGNTGGYETNDLYRDAGGDVSRLRSGISMVVMKLFGERLNLFRRRALAAMHYCDGWTPDLEALDGAAKRLLQVPAAKRFLFMVCDGDGENAVTFRAHVDMLHRKYGIVCIGLGIGCRPSFAQRFRYGAVVSDASRLAEDCLTTIVNAIRKDHA